MLVRTITRKGKAGPRAVINVLQCDRCKVEFERFAYCARLSGDFCGLACANKDRAWKPRRTLEEKLWSRVRKTKGCWVWVGVKAEGYGRIWVGPNKKDGAHRVSWVIHNGPIPPGLQVLHKCDNPPCVRPDHLFLGTQKDNVRDMVAKGRASRICKLTSKPDSVKEF